MEKPRIRFLKNKHSWVRKTFEEIAKRRTKSSDNPDFPRIEYQDIISGEGRLNKDLNKNIDCRKGIVFETNDILYGKLRPYLKNWLHPNFNGIALGDFWVLQARNCDSKFLFSLVQSPKFQRVANDTSGTKMPRSDWKTVSQTEFSIPSSNEEQSAIGSLFRTLDDLLASYKDNLANYQSLKATMLSKMFPKAGQTVPEIRLDGFEGEWKIKRADEIFKSVSEKNRALLPVLSASQIDGMVLRDEIGIDIKYDEATLNNYKVVKPGQFVIHLRSFQGGFALSKIEGITSPAYTIIDFIDKENHLPAFWNSILTSKEFIKRLETVTYGIRDGKSISFKDFSSLKFVFPNLEEQQAIGSYFSNLDNLINTYQEKISKLETLKKKLLQDMFI